MQGYDFTCKNRFLKYVQYDTQSDENSKTQPSTGKQKELLKELLSELKELGIDSSMDEYGYVYAKIQSNSQKNIPTIGFMAHVDTAPSVSGANVKPMIHQNYQGGNIKLPKENQTITTKNNPELHDMIGHDIITSDGSTLLGADDKAGVAEIMDALNYFVKHPHVKHGEIVAAFTIDEEIGSGLKNFDIDKFGAKYAYTLDGGNIGEIEAETFNGDEISIIFKGKQAHPGYAKGKMINSMRIASEFISHLPKDKWSPESTEGREGFVHVNYINGNEESTTLKIIVRDFDIDNMLKFEKKIEEILNEVINHHSGARFEFEIKEQYRNMIYKISEHPQIMKYALEAMTRVGIRPNNTVARGGTDGCKLSYMGIPTPNLFTGGHDFHSKTEWISVQDMEMAVRTIVDICKVWEEKG
ncbi:MAG: peptidase T [Candidatus Woesearchaeota archaeon]